MEDRIFLYYHPTHESRRKNIILHCSQASDGGAATAPPAPGQCDKTYNINELTFKIKDGIPTQLSTCTSTLVKEIAMSKVPFAKKPAPEPSSFMTKCTMDGVKASLPADFPGVDKVIGDTQKFLQNVLSGALSGGVPDPTKLVSAASDMSSLLDGINNLKENNPCLVDEPYTPPEPVSENSENKESGSEDEANEPKQSASGTAMGIIITTFVAGVVALLIIFN